MNSKGFTLVEVLVAMAIASVVGMAGVSLFSSANWSYKVNEDIAEVQQNVRIAADRLAMDIRGAGFGLPDPPFSLSFTGLASPLRAPVTVSNSAVGPDSITILGIGYAVGTLRRDGGVPSCNNSGDGAICLDSVTSANNFFTGTGPYVYEPNRRYISFNGSTFIELASVQSEANRALGRLTLGTPSALDIDYPNGTPVYIIQAIQYSVATDLAGCSATNPCLASEDFTGRSASGRQVVAESIEDLQLAYGVDGTIAPNFERDGKVDYTPPYGSDDYLNSPVASATILAVRANIVAKAKNPDPKGGSFTRPLLEDHPASAADAFRRRVLTKIIKLRNSRQGT